MARKSLGFVPLVWECPSCKTVNPGPIKTCTSCGAPQPEDVEFLQVDEEKFDFIKDEALIRMAKAGPDIHCPYCGTRNPAAHEHCSNCGGDLSLGGKARQAGQRVRSVQEAQAPPIPPTPPRAPANRPDPQPKSRTLLFILLAAVVTACLVAAYFLFWKADTVSATVTGVAWERSIPIEVYTETTASDWWDNIPTGAEIYSCTETYRYASSDPQPNATEVCSDPYVEDTGTGVGEVVQDCVYEVYDNYCEYAALDWVVWDVAAASGEDLNPFWPETPLSADQRAGTPSADYTITFSGDGGAYTYSTTDLDLFLMAEIGSQWTLEVTRSDHVNSAIPSY